MAINAVPLTVELAFGFGPGATPAPGDWVDVTPYLDVTPTSTGVVATSGRDSVRSGIGPGTLSFTLENADGRFNPRNTAGPYYGELDNGTQVRIRTTYAATTRTRWLGFIDSGWPQTITSRYPTVTITAHNLFGLMAQGEAPATTWDVVVAALDPDHWWQPGPDGWIDRVSGLVAPHTSALVEQPSSEDPIIDGSEKAWGQPTAEGYGSTEATSARLDTSATNITILTRFKLTTEALRNAALGAGKPVVLVHQGATNGEVPLTILVYPDYMQVFATTTTYDRSALVDSGSINLWDDLPHTVVVHVPEDSGDLRFWVDGREMVDVIQSTFASVNTIPLDRLYIGHNPTDPAAGVFVPYMGYIDPVIVWRDFAGDLATMAADTHAAAVAPWSNERMDERVTSIVTGMGLSAHLGALETSGIVTQQGYRQGEPLALLQTIEDTEQGRLWVDREGDLRLSTRSWSWDDTVSTVVQVTFSDDPTLIAGGAQEMLERNTVISDDPLNLVNVASVASEFGRAQKVEDATSIAKYGRRNAVQLTNLLHPSDLQSRAIADWLILSQGDPQIQARQVSFRVEDNPTVLAPLAAQIEEGWLVRIRKLTTADTLDLYAHVIGMEHEWSYTGWTVTLTLDATRTGYSFFKWGTSTWGGSAGWSF